MRVCFALAVMALASPAWSQETYRYDRSTRASDFSKDFFGQPGTYQRFKEIDMGHFNAGVGTTLDCGKLDINADFKGEFDKLQGQVKALVPDSPSKAIGLASQGAMMTVCYAYPTVCAQLRHDFLAMQTNLNLRSQACKAMDDYIDSSADKGAKQLRAEAQAECVSEKLASSPKMSMSAATTTCQTNAGLPLRDFQAGLEKKFTTGKQRVLQAMVDFAKTKDKPTYDFLAATLGEIEVQQDGYWQPMFAGGMLRPHDIADSFLAVAEEKACGAKLGDLVGHRPASLGSMTENVVAETIARRLSPDDVQNLGDLTDEDRRLACAALGRALGQVAAKTASAKAEAVLASGLLNTAIPNSLRDEYRTRGTGAFDAIKKAIDSDQIPPVEDVRAAIGQLARATREKNRVLASRISEGRLQNYRQESEGRVDCSDTLSCAGG